MDKKPRAKWGSPEWREQRRQAGKIGGRANVEKYGIEHMREMGRKSAEARKHTGEGNTVQGETT